MAAGPAVSPQLPPLDHSAAKGACETVFGEDPQVLAAVARPEVGLAVWCRQFDERLGTWLEGLPADALPSGRLLLRRNQTQRAVNGLLRAAQRRTPETEHAAVQDSLAADVAALTRLFSDLTGNRLVDLRLEALRHDACWRFHYDHVRLRLLCTYCGPATQWVPPEARKAALADQRAYRGPLHELPRFAVALFKGSLAPGQVGVVHRSPPVAGSGLSRLLLCLNEPSSISPLPWES